MIMTNEAAADILKNYLINNTESPQMGAAIMVALEEMERMRKIRTVMNRKVDVTCAGCRHVRVNAGRLTCPVMGRTMQSEDYCSYGERKNV